MEVLRLDSETSLPDELVEGYSSMIWTERHLDEGDFELKTAKVSETQNLLPEETLITHLDTQEVMIVETHSIERDENGFPELTIKGRTLETFAENRSLLPVKHGEEWKTLRQYTTADISCLLLWTHLANGSGEDPTRVDAVLNSRFQIPNFVITDSTDLSDAAEYWYLDAGELYPKLIEFMDLKALGIRAIRPSGSSGNVISVDTSRTASRGSIQRTLTQNIEAIRLDIYNGLDRSRDQTENTRVVFHYNSGHVDNPSYLFSIKDYKNLGVVNSPLGSFDIWPETGLVPPAVIPTGLDLRALYIDAGSLSATAPDDPSAEDYAQKLAEYEEARDIFEQSSIQKAKIELSNHNRKVIFDGAISTLSPYKYNEEYFLGDKVTLAAEYGFEETMRVVEYVRTEDQTGDRGYPTLVLTS